MRLMDGPDPFSNCQLVSILHSCARARFLTAKYWGVYHVVAAHLVQPHRLPTLSEQVRLRRPQAAGICPACASLGLGISRGPLQAGLGPGVAAGNDGVLLHRSACSCIGELRADMEGQTGAAPPNSLTTYLSYLRSRLPALQKACPRCRTSRTR